MFRLTAVVVLLLASVSQPIHAADLTETPGQVPQAWSDYAARVSRRLQASLANQQDPSAVRLHQFLDAQATKNSEGAPPSPIVRLWFSRTGHVGPVTFDSLGNPQADQDLRTVLSHPIGTAPPPAMRQPLVIRLRLTYSS